MRPLRVIVVVLALGILAPASALGALPRTYDVLRIDSPDPIGGAAFGWGIASADFTGDGKVDLAVAQSQGTPGQIFIFDGATGRHIDTIDPPEDNFDGSAPVLAFVYVETMPDIGGCSSGDGDGDSICDDATVGPGDGIPEIVAGSRSLRVDVDPADGDGAARDASDPKLGRAYIFDGRTRHVLKRIDMPVDDRKHQKSLSASPHFGRSVSSPQGLPACAGPAAEGNNRGVAPCPTPDTEGATDAVRLGDVDGGGWPDLVISARNYRETVDADPATPVTAFPGSQCAQSISGSCTGGRAWVYRGEDIANSSPADVLDTALHTIKNPDAQTTGSAEFGGNVFRIGDVGSCGAADAADMDCGSPGGQDGKPDFVIAARNMDYPLRNPDRAFADVGAAYLFDGATGALLNRLIHPEPATEEQFSGGFNAGPAPGDLGATALPDLVLGAPFHNSRLADDGRAYVFRGDARAPGGGGSGSWNFAQFDDPTPHVGENFGASTAGIGDVVPGPSAPSNEMLVGGEGPFDPFTEESLRGVNDVHIVNPQTAQILQSIPNPDNAGGDGFGVGITPMGDLNGDGFLDFAVSAYLSGAPPSGAPGQGRVFVFTSNDTPPPPAPAAPQPPAQQQQQQQSPGSSPPPAEAPQTAEPRALLAGRCRNDALGSNRRDVLRGTIAGDRMFGFSGNDSISGYQSSDCLDGGRGHDRLNGGDGNDRLFGRSGNDRLYGSNGRDRLKGEGGRDLLSGGHGNDLLAGGRSRDRMNGGPGNDRIFGEQGSDLIADRLGRNSIDAGPGNDRINVRNRRRDTVRCGSGRDVVRADRSDRIGSSCERVIFKSRKRRR